jgi:hypothetical protein
MEAWIVCSPWTMNIRTLKVQSIPTMYLFGIHMELELGMLCMQQS